MCQKKKKNVFVNHGETLHRCMVSLISSYISFPSNHVHSSTLLDDIVVHLVFISICQAFAGRCVHDASLVLRTTTVGSRSNFASYCWLGVGCGGIESVQNGRIYWTLRANCHHINEICAHFSLPLNVCRNQFKPPGWGCARLLYFWYTHHGFVIDVALDVYSALLNKAKNITSTTLTSLKACNSSPSTMWVSNLCNAQVPSFLCHLLCRHVFFEENLRNFLRVQPMSFYHFPSLSNVWRNYKTWVAKKNFNTRHTYHTSIVGLLTNIVWWWPVLSFLAISG